MHNDWSSGQEFGPITIPKKIKSEFKVIRIQPINSKAIDKKTKTFYVHTTMATNISNENNDDFDGVVNE